jgi:DNA topoisomerase-1
MSTWTVVSIQSKQRKQSPPMPFTTSTMQQEANRRLGMSVSQIMRCAQSLYESGFISYMRTDSTQLSEDAHSATERVVSQDYGHDLIAAPRKGKKSKNAQEAHEAIRPAIQPNGAFLRPHQMTGRDNDPSLRLYELIYQRTVASRMMEQVVNQTSVSVEGVSPDGNTTVLFRVSGSVVIDPGYTLASGRSSSDTFLPPLEEGQKLGCSNLTCISHSTQPPPRYNEASFVKELEALGVGRPSTYAGTVQILRDRAYVGTPLRSDDTGRRSGKARTGAAISAQRAAGGEGKSLAFVISHE